MPKKDPFELLLKKCIEGNRRSQKKLYELFYGYAMSISLLYVNNREDAAEIMNDSFLKVFTYLHSYHTQMPFKPWLRRIIINTGIDHFRKNERYLHVLYDEDKVSDEAIPVEFDSDLDILHLLQSLSPQYRMVFTLYVMEGYKHNEIAEMLNISEGTSRSNLLRAKENLKTLIQKNNISVENKEKDGRFLQKG